MKPGIAPGLLSSGADGRGTHLPTGVVRDAGSLRISVIHQPGWYVTANSARNLQLRGHHAVAYHTGCYLNPAGDRRVAPSHSHPQRCTLFGSGVEYRPAGSRWTDSLTWAACRRETAPRSRVGFSPPASRWFGRAEQRRSGRRVFQRESSVVPPTGLSGPWSVTTGVDHLERPANRNRHDSGRLHLATGSRRD